MGYPFPWAPAGRGKGGHLPPPGISKLSLLLFIRVICITFKKLKMPKPPTKINPKKIYIFFVRNFSKCTIFYFSNLLERSGIGWIERKIKFQVFSIFVFQVIVKIHGKFRSFAYKNYHNSKNENRKNLKIGFSFYSADNSSFI